MTAAFVLDASVALARCFQDEATEATWAVASHSYLGISIGIGADMRLARSMAGPILLHGAGGVPGAPAQPGTAILS